MEEQKSSLDALAARLRHDLETLQVPPPEWVIPHHTASGMRVVDIAVIGGGMCGLTTAFAARRVGITNIRIFDAGEAGREGPWLTYARMETLRSPKHLAGPALGVASLTFRAWYEAQYGAEGWAQLGKIPRPMWMEYLIWYRLVLGLPVENHRRLMRITPAAHGFDLMFAGPGAEESPGDTETVAARHVVLATGREGMARPRIPPPLTGLVGPRCRHSSEAIDFTAMGGQAVAVIGIGASAFDNAAAALEAGAQVSILARAPAVPRINKMKGATYPGFTLGFPGLPARDRLAVLAYVFRYRVAPPRDSVMRVFRHPGAELCLGTSITGAEREGARIRLHLNRGESRVFDQVIYCTGFHIDTAAPPETADFAGLIRTFRDSIADEESGDAGEEAGEEAGEDAVSAEFLNFPDLGPAFQFREKHPGAAPWLAGLHNFTFAATASHGNVSGDIPCVGDGAERLARGLAAQIFAEDFPRHLADLHAYEDPELLGDEIPGTPVWNPPLSEE